MAEPSTSSPKTWLITGCDKGLGHAIANAVLAKGDQVAATVLLEDGAQDLRERYGDACRTYQLDVRDPDRASTVVKDAISAFRSIDVCVSNAGYGLVGSAEETSEQEYRALFDVNFFGAVSVLNPVVEHMRECRSGHIICITSLVGFVGLPGFAFYSASKFALEGYCEALAQEVNEFGLKVSIIEPGGFRTDFAGGSLAATDNIIDDYAHTSGETRKYLKARHGTQPGDPSRLGEALRTIVELSDPPLRLQLGPDALEQATKKLARTLEDARAWEDLSLSTSFE